jgi:hydrogenase maturation protein HypF
MTARATTVPPADRRERRRLIITGVVQGVGFRPFVHGLATDLGLSGSVLNTGSGVVVEIEGAPAGLDDFERRLPAEAPPLAVIESAATQRIDVTGAAGFTIGESRPDARARTLVPPDVATCQDCIAELFDPADRRYRHPFISCTNCGPRYTVIVGLPYDRPATTMADLPLCSVCASEYGDPADRRFHAQTVACPDCGPQLRLHRPGHGDVLGDDALQGTSALLAAGAIVAVKGIGGFHLACDATNEAAVSELRRRKARGDKPFAVMVPDLATAAALAEMSDAEAALLRDIRRPVVLLRARPAAVPGLAKAVAPQHPDLGILLPYTPVHHLLLAPAGAGVDGPEPIVLVMTSGNVAGEPIVIDDEQAFSRLAGLADAWLTNDRPIHVPCDDSVLRVAKARVLPVRRSRGYAPLPIDLPFPVRPALAVGGDLKNTFCLADERHAWMSAHVGDMDDLATQVAFGRATTDLAALTGVTPELFVADRHPAYRSSAWAQRHAGDAVEIHLVQHHHAHLASAMVENGYRGAERVIGFAFDGTGYGDDGAAWGGEVLLADYQSYDRVGQLRYTPLPGGDAGVRNPCRMALSHLRSAGVAWSPRLPCVAACDAQERDVVARQLETGLNTGPTSSMGRLFDAMSALAGVCERVAYEAEAAMRFEEIAAGVIDDCSGAYRFDLVRGAGSSVSVTTVEPGPVIAAAALDVLADVPAAVVAARFHRAVSSMVLELARIERSRSGLSTVALSGGVFLNVLLTTLCEQSLARDGFRVLSHHRVPPSDAGIALGQIAIAARRRAD